MEENRDIQNDFTTTKRLLEGFQGWLLYFIVISIIAFSFDIYSLIALVNDVMSNNDFLTIFDLSYNSGLKSYIVLELFGGIAFLIWNLYIFRLIYFKKKITKRAWIFFQVAKLIFQVICFEFIKETFELNNEEFFKISGDISRTLLFTILLTIYLFNSKRVKNTFVN